MNRETEQRIIELQEQHPAWNGEQIAKALRAESSSSPGRTAVYEALRRIRLGAAQPFESFDTKQVNEKEKELAVLRKTIEQFAADRSRPYVIPSGNGNMIRFGVIGDTQIGSLYSRMDALAVFYDYVASQGITDVLHAGDVVDGHGVYRGQEWELRDRGWDEQLDRLKADYPSHKGITTHFITGNHDASFRKQIGINVGAEIAKSRPDFHFLGRDIGRITFTTKSGHTWTVGLHHPDGGTAYAISYKSQKTIESLSGGTKPNMIAIGHYHKAEMMPQYRNMVGLQVGCFQSQTPFMARKPTPAHVGGWVIEVAPSETPESLATRVKAEFVSFFEPEVGMEGQQCLTGCRPGL